MHKPNSSSHIFAYLCLQTFICIWILQTNPINAETTTTTGPLSGHGEPCRDTKGCKNSPSLSCDTKSNTCQCSNPNGMTYNTTEGKCYLNLGQNCSNLYITGYSTLLQGPECIKGAICDSKGICSCPPGFYKDVKTNTCKELKPFGANCTFSEECNQDTFLACVQGQCKCDPQVSILNQKTYEALGNDFTWGIHSSRNICVGKFNSSCYPHSFSQVYYTSGKNSSYCMEGSRCVGVDYRTKGTCQCTGGYVATTKGFCGATLAMPCTNNNLSNLHTCADGLRCLGFKNQYLVSQHKYNGKLTCQCENPAYQEYDREEKVCKSLIGTFCNPNYSKSCIRGGSCVKRDDVFRCECGDGFVESFNGTCEIAHGSPCNYEIYDTDICDTQARLMCIDRKCGCINGNDIYENDRRRCSRPVGMRCNAVSQCVSNSHCFKASENNQYGYCRCDSGFMMTQERTCRLQDSSTENEEGTTEDYIMYNM